MSHKVIYKCDRCGTESEGLKLFDIALGVRETKYSSYSGTREYLKDELNRNAQWCEKCCAETGIKFQAKPDKPLQEPQSTLEDVIREWISEEVAARTQR